MFWTLRHEPFERGLAVRVGAVFVQRPTRGLTDARGTEIRSLKLTDEAEGFEFLEPWPDCIAVNAEKRSGLAMT